METIALNSWDEFLARLPELEKDRADRELISELLFRGHADETWALTTTLERHGQKNFSFIEYYKRILVARHEIEAFTNNKWDVPDLSEMAEEAKRYEFFHHPDAFYETYGYMVHLRHHGFPSPLLDWSRSPFVAAYFAFARPKMEGNVSIYALKQANSSSSSSNQPSITTLGPNVRTHKRHFLQQCEYTLCASMADRTWRFAEHESASTDWDTSNKFLTNSQIIKFNLPATQRAKVLENLDQYNLNAFSLFGSEEGLMEAMAHRAFDFKQS